MATGSLRTAGLYVWRAYSSNWASWLHRVHKSVKKPKAHTVVCVKSTFHARPECLGAGSCPTDMLALGIWQAGMALLPPTLSVCVSEWGNIRTELKTCKIPSIGLDADKGNVLLLCLLFSFSQCPPPR